MNQMNLQALQAMMAQSSQNARKPHVEFRAGMCNLSGTTVTADTRRGKVVLSSEEDGLLHLKWTLRPSNKVEKDVCLFPQSATWEKVPECTTGRVFLLRFKSSSRKEFFWMQEPKDDKDEEYLKKINELIANPPPAGGEGMMGSDMNQQQLMQMLSGRGGRSSAGSGGGGSSGSGGGSGASGGSGSGSSTQAQQQAALAASLSSFAQQLQAQQAQQAQYNLPDILDPERVIPILNEDDALAQALLEHLPESQRNPAQLRNTLRSPQFQQAAGRLTAVLNSEQFATVMASFQLPLSPTGDMGVPAFLSALQSQAEAEKEKEDKDQAEKKEGEDKK